MNLKFPASFWKCKRCKYMKYGKATETCPRCGESTVVQKSEPDAAPKPSKLSRIKKTIQNKIRKAKPSKTVEYIKIEDW